MTHQIDPDGDSDEGDHPADPDYPDEDERIQETKEIINKWAKGSISIGGEKFLKAIAGAVGTSVTALIAIGQFGEMIASFGEDLAENPGEVGEAVLDWFRATLVDVIFRPILELLVNTVFKRTWQSMLKLLFGGNKKIGLPPGETEIIGLFDLPIVLVTPIAGIITAISDPITAMISSINTALISGFADLGIASPIILPSLWVVEVSVGIWVIWVAINTIDIPFVKPAAAIDALLWPVRGLMRWFS